jgi:hypothetical protein
VVGVVGVVGVNPLVGVRPPPVHREEMVERLRAFFGEEAVTLSVVCEQQCRGSARARRQSRGDHRATLVTSAPW